MKQLKLNQKGFGAVVIFLIVFVVLGIFTIIYLLNYNSSFSKPGSKVVNSSASPNQSGQPINHGDLNKTTISCNFPDEIDDCDDNAEFSTWVDDKLP